MAHQLGDLLVSMGAATREAVQAALENQVLFGGRLGTNLLELGGVTEERLAEALARCHRCAAACGDVPVDPRAVALLTPERVERLEVVPARLDGRRLDVLVADPADLARLDEVAFATGKQVRPVVVPEARLWALLRKHYGVEREVRGFSLEGLARPPRAPAPTPSPAPAPEAGFDLMDEEEFAALYADRSAPGLPGRPAGSAARPPAPPPARPAARLPAPGAEEIPLPGVPAGEWTGPLPGHERAGPPPPSPAAFAGGSMVSNDEILAALQTEASTRTPAPLDSIALAPAVEPEPPPLRFEDAVASLAGVADRNAIARTVLRFARSRFRRAVLLTVHGDLAEGWDGAGDGLSAQAVARVRVRVSQPGVVHTVVTSRAHFLGPLQKTDQNVNLLRALGRGAPKSSFAMPILARGRVVNVLYADDGRGALVDPAGIGELLILAAKIAQSYEALLARAN